ncbi:MAG: ATP-binding protein [Myxococcota bacterium]
MDEETLAGLEAAYRAAPSSELARLLIRGLIEHDRLDDARRIYGENESVRSDEWDEQLGLEGPDHSAADNDRHRLRLIDGPEPDGVFDLDRYREKTTDFSDVVGLDAIKKQVSKKIIQPFQKPSLFARFRKKIGGGVLLYGPPGCGKTLLARATAGECQATFFNVQISDVLDMYIGESERKLNAIFDKARQEAPSVVFFDEIEALAGKREHARNASHSNVVSQMLTELDGFAQNNSQVLVLGATNVPWSLDPAFLRPGRFDRMFFVPPPDRDARAAILAHHMRERPAEAAIDFNALAAKTAGYSGADLENLVETAADEAIDESLETESDSVIRFAHLKNALGDTRSTTVEWLTTARNYARYANDGGRYDEVNAYIKRYGK